MKKRMLIVGIIFFMVALPLQGCSNSSSEVRGSIEDITELTTDLTSESTDEITTETTIELTTESTTELITEIPTEVTTQAQIVQSNIDAIYVTKTGKKYHYNNNCNGATYIEITLEQLNADYSTLEPCSKCAI